MSRLPPVSFYSKGGRSRDTHGCTEENLRKLVLGLKQVGSRSGAPYNRATGAGFVAAHNGQYADALSKGGKASASPYSSPRPQVRSQPHS